MSAPARGAGAAVDLLDRTRELIAIPSVSGEEAALADHCAARLAGVAGETRRSGDNLVHRGPRRDGRPLVVLAGHLDTVPPQGNAKPRREGDTLWGLGATDMKAGLAVMLALAEGLDLERARFDLAWIFYVCEEIAFERNGLRTLWEPCPWLAEADLAIVCEPTDAAFELGCNGTLHAEIVARGRAAHSARPWQGENAVYKALPLLERLARREPEPVSLGGVTYKETLVVTQVEALGARNVIPERFSLNLNFRFAPHRTPDQAAEHLRALVPEEFTFSVRDVAPPAPPASDHPLLAELLASSGLERRAKQGWTDVSQFAARKVAAVNLGPGDPELAHRADEHVSRESLERVHGVLRDFLAGDA